MDEAVAVLPVLPWTLAAVATVLVVALSVPPGGPRPATLAGRTPPVATRLGALLLGLLVVGAVLVARLGPVGELGNPVPAAVVGLGWPLLLLLPGLVGLASPFSRRVAADEVRDADPDAAREDAPDVVQQDLRQHAREDVRPAVLAALAVVGYLVLPAAPLRPATIATALAAYALVVVAVAVALGRAAAGRVEALGLLATWGAVGRGLPRWAAPRGALAVAAVVLGGGWFERYERSTAWTVGLPGRGTTAVGLALALSIAVLGALLLHVATRGRGAPGTAAAVLLPLALATAAAGVLRRALISAQVLADQAAGPRGLDPDPFGILGGQALALGLVVLGGCLSSAVLARRVGVETARLPGVAVLLALTAASAWVVLQP